MDLLSDGARDFLLTALTDAAQGGGVLQPEVVAVVVAIAAAAAAAGDVILVDLKRTLSPQMSGGRRA